MKVYVESAQGDELNGELCGSRLVAVLSPPPISAATTSTPSHNDEPDFGNNGWLDRFNYLVYGLLLIDFRNNCDRIGQRFVLIIGLLTIAAGIIGTFAVSANAMLLSRFIEGIGFSASTVAARA